MRESHGLMTEPSNTELARQLLTHMLSYVQAHGDPERLRENEAMLLGFVDDLASSDPQVIAETASYAAQLAVWVALAATGDLDRAGALIRDVLLQSVSAETNMPPGWAPGDPMP
jgi:hypothetical protein